LIFYTLQKNKSSFFTAKVTKEITEKGISKDSKNANPFFFALF